MKFKTVLLAALFVLLAAVRMHAQDDINGCGDSPENPTLVLGLIVGAAGVGYPRVRRYLQGRNRGKNK